MRVTAGKAPGRLLWSSRGQVVAIWMGPGRRGAGVKVERCEYSQEKFRMQKSRS